MSNKYEIPIHSYWTSYLQSIQKSLSHDYYYYKTGQIKIDKYDSVIAKLSDYYRLNDTAKERYNRFQKGYSVVVLHVLKVGDLYHFILMCRSNIDKSGLFFERESYFDARDKRHRISFNDCYEFVRVNKDGYKYGDEEVEAKNGVWTVKISDKEKARIYEYFNDSLYKRNYLNIKQICYGLSHWIGFAGVRQDYIILKHKLEERYHKFNQSQTYKLKPLPEMPKVLNVVKYAKVKT